MQTLFADDDDNTDDEERQETAIADGNRSRTRSHDTTPLQWMMATRADTTTHPTMNLTTKQVFIDETDSEEDES